MQVSTNFYGRNACQKDFESIPLITYWFNRTHNGVASRNYGEDHREEIRQPSLAHRRGKGQMMTNATVRHPGRGSLPIAKSDYRERKSIEKNKSRKRF